MSTRCCTAILALALMLLVGAPMQLLAEGAAAKASAPPQGLRGFGSQLPASAVPGSTAERRAAWESLTPKEQEQKIEEFIKRVGPGIERELADRAKQPRPAPPQLVAGRPGEGVFTRPSPASNAGRLSFAGPSQAPIEPCFGLSCGDNEPPQVSASASPNTGAAPLSVQFSTWAYDPDGYIASLFWSFGDGGYAYDFYPIHTYTTPGTYYADVTATDDQGASAWASVVITVGGGGGNQPPQVSLSASPLSGSAPLNVSFNASASDPDGWITSYSWSFGDGGSAAGTSSLSHTYQSPGSFTASLTVTDNLGATATASVALQANGSTSDSDQDGLDDGLEAQLATGYMPIYHVSAGEQAGTGFARFQDVPTLAILQNLPPVPPAVHWRVSPLFVANLNGVPHQFLQIDYLTVWNRDDGLEVSGFCRFNATILGGLVGFGLASALDGAGPHPFDPERSAALVAAPLTSAGDPGAYRSLSYYLASHEGTFFDHSIYLPPPSPLPPGNHALMWHSRSKHATYEGNPDYFPLFPSWVIYTTYFVIEDLYWFGWIDWWDYLIYLSIADSVFFSCVVEHFSGQGGFLPGFDLNVGENGRPQNGSSWIADPRIASKLQPLWILVQ